MSGDAGGGRVGDGMSGDARGWDDGGGGGGGLTVAVGMEWAGTMMTDERTRSGSKSVIRFIKSQTKLLLRQRYFSDKVTSPTTFLQINSPQETTIPLKPRLARLRADVSRLPFGKNGLDVPSKPDIPRQLLCTSRSP